MFATCCKYGAAFRESLVIGYREGEAALTALRIDDKRFFGRSFTMNYRVRVIAFFVLGASLYAGIPAFGQSYPTKPIKIISTIPLGGSGDVAMRMAAAKMTESMGQVVLVETNGAGGGLVAARLVVKVAPDG